MNRITTLISAGFGMLLLATAPAQAATITLTSTLNGLNSAPQNASAATGTAMMSYDDVSNLFNLSIDITGINKSVLNGAHIHLGGSGANGPVAFNLGTTAWTDTATGMNLILTGGLFPGANSSDLVFGKTYLNIHTLAFGAGEIRGQLTAAPVPVPAAAWLLGSGLLGLLGAASRKKVLRA